MKIVCNYFSANCLWLFIEPFIFQCNNTNWENKNLLFSPLPPFSPLPSTSPSSFSPSLPRSVSHWRFAHKQVLHNEQQKRTGMNNRTVWDKKVPRGNTHTLCRTDAEGKVRALVRAGITDTLSRCVHPVHHVHLHTRSVSSNPRVRELRCASHQSTPPTFTYSTVQEPYGSWCKYNE